jgi:hypothetical protein
MQVTALSVMATPGPVRSFSAKTAADVIAPGQYAGLTTNVGRLLTRT